MRLGFSTVMYEGTGLSYPAIISKAAALGYDGVELNFKVWPSELNIDEIEDSLDRSRIEIAAIGTRHMHVTHGLYLASPQEDVRRRALAYVTDCMRIARKLDCSIVQAGWAFQGSKLEAAYDVAWRQAVESLRKVGELGREHEVDFVIEFLCKQNGELVNTMDDALRMLDDVGLKNVFVMADTFHIYGERDSFRETVLKADGRLRYVHIADSDRLLPGAGRINFREFIGALKEIDYEGYMVMEFNPNGSPDKALKLAIGYVRGLLR